MAVVKRTQVINKPVDVVFQTVVDVATFRNWNPTTAVKIMRCPPFS